MLRNIAMAMIVAFAAFFHLATAMSTISTVGSKFFTSDGDQFYIKGVAYQLSESDPLVDGNQCTMDAKQMKDLGANTIRVYHVDATADHKACMTAFEDQGIYLFLDLDTFTTQITGASPHWNQTQYNRFSAVLDEFQQYDNLAGFFVGNEVLTVPSDSPAAVYVKAAARDMKAYAKEKKYRNIPIGYSAADIAQLRPMLQDYLVCGDNKANSIDFFSLNAYEWCGTQSYPGSGYSVLQSEAEGYPIPIFFSETGCITAPPRTFTDQAAILGPHMDDTWSGAIVYEWIQEANHYGLVDYGGVIASGEAPVARSGTPTPISPDYSNLKGQWATLTPSGVKLSDYSASASHLTTPACPSSTHGTAGWAIQGNPSIPAVGQKFDPTATATESPASKASSTAAAAKASASSTKGSAATGGKEVTGMTLGLAGVMLSFIVWL